ncbi:MAG: Uma2 family endonuclease [Blastocatellia bacterium]|nr:Uma2 family endonuclease [Blastocatellia bacterium]
MSIQRKHFHTLAEYFALEKVGDARYEYWNGEIVCMNGGSEAHGRISGNVFGSLYSQLKGRSCTAFTSEIPIKTPKLPPYRYPDASVACGKAVFEKMEGIGVLTNPVLIVEILSEHTEKADRGVKFEAYKTLESFREYMLVAQNEPHLTHFIKQENGEWKRFDTADLNGTLKLETIDCSLALADVYEDVTFE